MGYSTKHHKRVSINAPPHSEAPFWLDLGLMLRGGYTQRELIKTGMQSQALTVANQALYR